MHSAAVVSRAFAWVDGRRVHYRHAGAGAPVVLLHQSPRSSAELEPLMRELAPHFLVLAPDTPGFGQSDPVAPSYAEPTIDAFADALVALLDALGLQRVALYGTHTGAIIAVRVASRYPERIATLVANGILLTTPAERSEKGDRYLPALIPQWDGGHLAWLWHRLREQLDFYPWYRHDPDHRIHWAQPLEDTDATALDLLESGDDYRGAYQAISAYAIDQDLTQLQVPTLLLVARTDALSRFVEHYPPLPAGVEVSVVPGFGDIAGATLQWLLRSPPPPARLAPPRAAPSGRLHSTFVELPAGRLHLRRATGRGGRPILVLHDLGGSATSLSPMLAGMAGPRTLLAFDLPGHGESERCGATRPEEIASVLGAALDALEVANCDIVALGAATAIAFALRTADTPRVARLVLLDPALRLPDASTATAAAQLPDLAPDAAGTHLMRGWWWLRDRALFFPWHDRSAGARLARGWAPRPVERHRMLVDLLKARGAHGQQLAAALDEATPAALAASGATVLATPGAAIYRFALPAGAPPVGPLPDERAQWGSAILRALADDTR
jgi:haloalkane dehalogenase